MPNKNARMALVYDFDGTLAPGNLQENSFIPDVGMKPSDFWNEVDQLAKRQQADRILMYMHVMLDKAKSAKISVHPEDFKKRGATIEFFDGVQDWFDRISDYGKSKRVNVEHYNSVFGERRNHPRDEHRLKIQWHIRFKVHVRRERRSLLASFRHQFHDQDSIPVSD